MSLREARMRRTKDFGLSGNLTLPLSANREECTTGKVFMSDEKKERKKHTRFAVDHKPIGQAEKVEKDGPRLKRRHSLAGFIRGFFQRRRRKRKSPYHADASVGAISSVLGKGGREGIRRSESDPQIANILQSEDERSKEEEGQDRGAAPFRRKDMTSALSYQKPEAVVTTLIGLTLKRKDSSSGLHKVILEHREDIDNLGLHLSGGLPPVTVTHIEPGGQSEKAGIKVGDILLNVNGLNCQEKVGIAQLMHLKLILKQDYIDETTRDKIRARANNLDSEEESDVQLRITSIDSLDELEPTTPPLAVKAKMKKKKGKPRRQSAEIGPLATNSPVKEDNSHIKKGESSSSLTSNEYVKEEETCEGKGACKKVTEEKKNKQTNAFGEEMSTVQNIQKEEEVNHLKRGDRNRRSVSPKRRYHMDEADTTSGEESVDGRVVTGVIRNKIRAVGKSETGKSSKDVEKRKKKRYKAAEKKVERKSKVASSEASVEPMEGKKDRVSLFPETVTGSFKSDTIEYASKKSSPSSRKRESKDDLSPNSPKREKNEYLRTNSLKREKNKKEDKVVSDSKSMISSCRSSVDQFFSESTEHSTKYSQSFSTTEMQKRFRENLRQASKSEQDMVSMVASLDSNIKVKKSGQVKEEKSQVRPSIFNHSSSIEPEEGSEWSLGAMGGWESRGDENLLDVNFKVKKSGVLVKKKVAVTTRPSILENQPSGADFQPGEIKYNREVEMDLSYVPWIMPSLGLVAGRNRRDASNRSLVKRRPPSLRQKAESSELKEKPGTWRTAAARKLFEHPNQKNNSKWILNAHPVVKSMDKTLMTPSISSKSKPMLNTTATKIEDRLQEYPGNARANTRRLMVSAAATQSLVDIDPVQLEGAYTMETVPKQSSTSTTTTTFTSSSKDNSIPAMGHVAECLAMFQN